MSDIDERKIRILQAIISDYITTAEPVGSRTIAKKYDLGISSATIRNEMADLEDMGYLEQPHSSAGRKPSDKGYRLYVDKLMPDEALSLEDELRIKGYLVDEALYEVDKMLKQATYILSELTKLTCILKAPSVNKSHIKSIQLLAIDVNSILVVMVTDGGIIKNSLIRVEKAPNQDVLLKISNALANRIRNLTLEQINLEVINNLKSDLSGYDDIFNAIIPAIYDTLNHKGSSEVYTEGTANIFNYPEFNDIEKARDFLSLIGNRELVNSLINTDGVLTIKIGEENYVKEAKDCSVITASYSLGNVPVGTIGLIGPTRIPYSKIMTIVGKVMKELNESLRQYSDY
ncbi:heat-inducible transcriptional repressor HrcA [Clostridium frigidicarnis]|uniref:Heat-inducible transcription repressor HrcA n=1 Tax=Clostridium frigidicarnis TaxID=84698 RepID=A0A1I0VH48_9CLOT|nr:heat-inducible transcriptional repressor HrcA [Clostridium frigidicarnis]SFA75538.1 heat-inducible transcription repressor HrcA [Clostridium frigidicarnis]